MPEPSTTHYNTRWLSMTALLLIPRAEAFRVTSRDHRPVWRHTQIVSRSHTSRHAITASVAFIPHHRCPYVTTVRLVRQIRSNHMVTLQYATLHHLMAIPTAYSHDKRPRSDIRSLSMFTLYTYYIVYVQVGRVNVLLGSAFSIIA